MQANNKNLFLFACAAAQLNCALAYLIITRRRMHINQNKKLLLLWQKETLLKKNRFSSLAKPTCWFKKRQNGCLLEINFVMMKFLKYFEKVFVNSVTKQGHI